MSVERSEQEHIRLALPTTGPEELDSIARVLATGHLAQGPVVRQFEEEVAVRVGVRFGFATSSATTALHLSLVALGIGPGDEVLVPDFTFPATANVVIQQGATPVLVDIELETYTIDVNDLERKITPRTRAIMPVHTFGAAANMTAVCGIARAHGLKIVEDAACAIAATYEGRQCGSLGDVGCFSFHPRKLITTGEGGLIATDDADLARRIGVLRSHGGIRTRGRVTFEQSGFNYRMSDINAAVGLAQLRRLDGLLARRRELASGLTRRLRDVPGVRPPTEPAAHDSLHTYQTYTVLLADHFDRDAVIADMAAQGDETTLGTDALHAEPAFARLGYRPGDLPRSHTAVRQTLALPMHPALTEDDCARIVATLSDALRGQSH